MAEGPASDDRRAPAPQATGTGGLNRKRTASDDRRAPAPQATGTGGLNRKRILVAEFGRAHGVRGLVRLHAYTEDPRDLARYALTDEAGVQRFAITLLPDGLARVEGVAGRDAAQRLTGTKLYVDRASLPPPAEEEFLLVDLQGLAAFDAAGASLGQVVAVEDHGAGAYLTLAGPAGEKLVPFTRRCVPVVDIAAGRIVVELPAEVIVPASAEGAAA